MDLQDLCRLYLKRVRCIAAQVGLSNWVDATMTKNENGDCKATEEQVELLSKICSDDRIERSDIPKILNKSYRQCCKDGSFDKIKTFNRVGIYSKVSTMLLNPKKTSK